MQIGILRKYTTLVQTENNAVMFLDYLFLWMSKEEGDKGVVREVNMSYRLGLNLEHKMLHLQ